MNDLSLFLYAAGAVENVSGLLVVAIFVLSMVTMVAFAHYSLKEMPYPHWKKMAAIIVLVSLVAALLPSKDTMYAIAASELGEEAVKSSIGQKSLSAIEAWLDKQLEKK